MDSFLSDPLIDFNYENNKLPEYKYMTNERPFDSYRKMEKLGQFTGRQSSLRKIEPYLTSENEEEAMKNGEMIRKSDRIAKNSGR